MNNMYGNTIGMAAKALDFLWKKESAASANLANVETPGYKSKYVTFEEEFRKRIEDAALKEGDARSQVARAIEGSSYKVNVSERESSRRDGNNVNADVEVMELTRTALQYQYLTRSVSSDISRLNTVITGQ